MANNQVTLTCIVSTYNCENFIEECINSLLLQETKYQFVILIIDDCSTDNTRKIVEKIQQRNPTNNIHYFSTEKNMGLGKYALQELEKQIKPFLKSDYLYRIDSDDYIINPHKFEKQISFLEEHPECVGICHHFKIINEKNNTQKIENTALTGIYSAKELLKLAGKVPSYNHTATYLYRNIHQSSLPPEFQKKWAKGDVLYNWAMLQHGKVCFTNDVMSIYRIHGGGVWSSLSEAEKKMTNKLLTLKIFFLLNLKNKLYLKKKRNLVFIAIKYFFIKGKKKFKEFFLRSSGNSASNPYWD